MPLKHYIPIKSITPNPHAGETVYLVPGRTEQILECNEKVTHDKLVLVYFYKINDNAQYKYIVHPDIKQDELLDLLRNLKDFKLIVKQDVQTLHSITPQPKNIVEYWDCPVSCYYCHEQFFWRELKSDSNEWFDEDGYTSDYSYSDRVCPKCGHWDCCILNFQKEEDYEKNNI